MNSLKAAQADIPAKDARQSKAERTRDGIEAAVEALFDERGGAEEITFRAVAERAGVTEMTVYRHFPTREDLLQGLWRRMNARMGDVGMPETEAELLNQHDALFNGFDRIAPQIVAAITTPQGREMRAALNKKRRKAFVGIVEEAAPHLSASEKTQAAAVLQLLHSAYAWDSLREQWGMTGKGAAKTTRWAIELILDQLRTAK